MLLQNLKLSYYLNFEILRSFVAILLILALIIFGNQIFLVLKNSASQGIVSSELISLIFLKTFRDINLLLGLSSILAIILTLNRFYKSSELIVIKTAGYGENGILKILLPLISFFVILSALFSIFFSPLAKNEINFIKENAKSRPDYIFFKEGTFQSFQDGEVIFFAQEISNKEADRQNLKNVFIFSKTDSKLTTASSGLKIHNPSTESIFLELYDGHAYENLNFEQTNISITNFEKYRFNLYSKNKEVLGIVYPEARYFFDLSISKKIDLAEMLFRISIPISLLILVILSVYISKINPRKGKNFSPVIGVIFFIAYYNLLLFSKSSVEAGVENAILMYLYPHLFFIISILFINLKKHFS